MVVSCPCGLLEPSSERGHTRNAFFHAWLFHDVLSADSSRAGAQAWPLVSVVDWPKCGDGSRHAGAGTISGLRDGAAVSDIERWCGCGWTAARPADQHFHQFSLSDELIASADNMDDLERAQLLAALGDEMELNIGSDMALFSIPPFSRDGNSTEGPRVALGDVVAVELDKRKVHIVALIAAPHEDRQAWIDDIAAATVAAIDSSGSTLDLALLEARLEARYRGHPAVPFLQRFR